LVVFYLHRIPETNTDCTRL